MHREFRFITVACMGINSVNDGFPVIGFFVHSLNSLAKLPKSYGLHYCALSWDRCWKKYREAQP